MKRATSTRYFTLFATTLGHCGIAWNEHGIIRSALPDPDLVHLRAHLTRGLDEVQETDQPPPAVAQVIAQIQALLAGEPGDLSAAVLDLREIPNSLSASMPPCVAFPAAAP